MHSLEVLRVKHKALYIQGKHCTIGMSLRSMWPLKRHEKLFSEYSNEEWGLGCFLPFVSYFKVKHVQIHYFVLKNAL